MFENYILYESINNMYIFNDYFKNRVNDSIFY